MGGGCLKMGLSANQGGSAMERLTRATTLSGGKFTGQKLLTLLRVRWNSSGDLGTADQCVWAVAGMSFDSGLFWDGTVSRFIFYIETDSGLALWEIDIPISPVASIWYDVAVYWNGGLGDDADVSLYMRATSGNGTAGLTGGTGSPTLTPAGTAVLDHGANPVYFLNNSGATTPLIADVRDLAILECSASATISTAVEWFGKGAAPFQLADGSLSDVSGLTLRYSPADVLGRTANAAGAATNGILDRVDGTAYTVSGTAQVLAASEFDGPLWDVESATLPSVISTSIMARYDWKNPRKTSAGKVFESPDLSGGGSHQCQPTASTQPEYVVIDGKPVTAFDFAATSGLVRNMRVRLGAGRSGTAHSAAKVLSVQAPLAAQAAVTIVGTYLTNSSGTQFVCDRWLIGTALNSARYGVSIGGQDPPASQNPQLAVSINPSFTMFTYKGAGASNCIAQVDDDIATSTQTDTAATRYVFGSGYTDSNAHAAMTLSEEVMWTADKSASSAEIRAWLEARNGVVRPTGAVLALGSSSEQGLSALKCQQYLARMPRVNRKGLRVINCGRSSYAAGSRLMDASGGSGTFELGEPVSDGGSGTFRFLSEAGGKLYGYEGAGTTLAASGTITGARSGATRSFSSVTFNTNSEGIADAKMLDQACNLAVRFLNSPNGIAFFLNTGSNGCASADGDADNEYAALLAIITLLTGRVRLYGGSAATGTFTGSEVVTLDGSSDAISGKMSSYKTDTGLTQLHLFGRVGTWPSSGAVTGLSSGATFTFSGANVFPATPRIIVRMHQPRSTTAAASVHTGFRDLLRIGAAEGRFRLADISVLPEFDDYASSSDYGNTAYYFGDNIHMNSDGHGLVAPVTDRAIVPTIGGSWRDRSFRSRGAVR